MTDIAQLGQRFVDRAKPEFKRFKSDFEAIGAAAVKAMKAGELSRDEADALFLDRDHTVTSPLQRLYLERGLLDLVDRFHRATESIKTAAWPTPLAKAALDGFVAAGEGARAVALARFHLEKRRNALRADLRERKRKPNAEGGALMIALSAATIADLPARKAELIAAIDRFAALFAAHGTEQDKTWLDLLRAEVRA